MIEFCSRLLGKLFCGLFGGLFCPWGLATIFLSVKLPAAKCRGVGHLVRMVYLQEQALSCYHDFVVTTDPAIIKVCQELLLGLECARCFNNGASGL